jgi:hypothetical protein
MTEECRPPDGAEDGSWHVLIGASGPQVSQWTSLSNWSSVLPHLWRVGGGFAQSVNMTTLEGYRYSHPLDIAPPKPVPTIDQMRNAIDLALDENDMNPEDSIISALLEIGALRVRE